MTMSRVHQIAPHIPLHRLVQQMEKLLFIFGLSREMQKPHHVIMYVFCSVHCLLKL